jgi:hypothetical protein
MQGTPTAHPDVTIVRWGERGRGGGSKRDGVLVTVSDKERVLVFNSASEVQH